MQYEILLGSLFGGSLFVGKSVRSALDENESVLIYDDPLIAHQMDLQAITSIEFSYSREWLPHFDGENV